MRQHVTSVSAALVLFGTMAFAAASDTRPLPWARALPRPGSGRTASFCPRERFQARLARLPARAGGSDTLPEFLLDTLRTFGPSPEDEQLGGIAAGASSCLAVWDGGLRIRAARLTLDGTVIDSVGFRVSPAREYCLWPAAAFDGTNWLVVWTQFDTLSFVPTIRGARVSSSGVVLDSQGIAIAPGDWAQYLPAVGFDGTNWLVAWTDFRSGWEADVYAARVSSAGVVLDPNGIAVSTATGNQSVYRGIASDGTNSLIAWHDDRSGSFDIYAARITPAGTVLDPDGIQVAGQPSEQALPCATFDGTNYFLVWLDDRTTPDEFEVYGARLSPAGTVIDPNGIRISSHPAGFGLGLAFGGGNHLVTWDNSDDGNVYAARVSPAGVVLDPGGIALSPGGYADQVGPAVCFTADRYVAAWTDWRNWNQDVYATQVTPGGTVPDPARLVTWGWSSPVQHQPVAAFDGSNWLVVWADERDGMPGIYGTRVTREGVVLDPQGIAIATGGQWAPAIAFDGSNYLVVWEDWRLGADIYGTRVSPAGVVLDPQGIAVATGPDAEMSPAVAADGAHWLVVWNAEDEQSNYEIRAARVTPAGSVLAPEVVCSGTCMNPAVAAGPDHWLVAWSDARDNDWVLGVYAARVAPNGSVVDPDGFPVAVGPYDRGVPAVASDGTNWLVAWMQDPDGSCSFDVYAARVGPQGTVLDPAGIPVAVSAEEQYWLPDVGFNGSTFLVVWANAPWIAREIRGGRVSRAGVVLDPGGVPLISGPLPRHEPRLSPDCGLLVFTGEFPKDGPKKALAALLRPAAVADRGPLPSALGLIVRPSPARVRTTVRFSLPNPQDVRLTVHDAAGRLVRTLVSGRFPAGLHDRTWDLKSDAGARVPAGVYLLRLEAGTGSDTRKLVVR